MGKLSRIVIAGALSALTGGSLTLAGAASPAAALDDPGSTAADDPIVCSGTAPGQPTGCEPADPCEGLNPPAWCTFQAPANGYSWSMAKRFTASIAGFRWDEANARYDANHVHPATWRADFWACGPRPTRTALTPASRRGTPTPGWSAGRRRRGRAAA
jgi:hypothetical protein